MLEWIERRVFWVRMVVDWSYKVEFELNPIDPSRRFWQRCGVAGLPSAYLGTKHDGGSCFVCMHIEVVDLRKKGRKDQSTEDFFFGFLALIQSNVLIDPKEEEELVSHLWGWLLWYKIEVGLEDIFGERWLCQLLLRCYPVKSPSPVLEEKVGEIRKKKKKEQKQGIIEPVDEHRWLTKLSMLLMLCLIRLRR